MSRGFSIRQPLRSSPGPATYWLGDWVSQVWVLSLSGGDKVPTVRTVVRNCMLAGHFAACLVVGTYSRTLATISKQPRKELSAGPGPSQDLVFNFLSMICFLLFEVMAFRKEREGERPGRSTRAPGLRWFRGLWMLFTPNLTQATEGYFRESTAVSTVLCRKQGN